MRPILSNSGVRSLARVGGAVASDWRPVDQLRELVRLAEQAHGAGQREVAASLISRAYLLHDGSLEQATH